MESGAYMYLFWSHWSTKLLSAWPHHITQVLLLLCSYSLAYIRGWSLIITGGLLISWGVSDRGGHRIKTPLVGGVINPALYVKTTYLNFSQRLLMFINIYCCKGYHLSATPLVIINECLLSQQHVHQVTGMLCIANQPSYPCLSIRSFLRP